MSHPKNCIFCGAKPLSEEHIWSKWTYDLLPKRKGTTHERGIILTSRGSPKIRGIKTLKKYQGDVSGIKVKAVCRSKDRGTNSKGEVGCNNGWMSDQEERVKPILSPLIVDQPIVMGEDQQRILSAWIATKVMVAEFSNPDDVVSTDRERQYLKDHWRPPDTWKIWIARQTGRAWRSGYNRHALTLGALNETGTPVPHDGTFRKNTQLVTIGIGNVLFHVFSSREPAISDRGYKNQVALFRIHPFGGNFLWPPSSTVSDANIQYLVTQFDRWLSTLNWTPGP